MEIRNRNFQTFKAPVESPAMGTSLFTTAATKQMGSQKSSPE